MNKSFSKTLTVLVVILAFFTILINCPGNKSGSIRDSGYIYVGGAGDGKIYVVNLADETVDQIIDLPAGASPDWLTFNPDYSYLYCSSKTLIDSNFYVFIINTQTNTFDSTIDVCSNPMGIAFTNDGSKAAVLNINGADIALIDTATKTYDNIASDTIYDISGINGIAIHPVTDRIYCVNPTFKRVTYSESIGTATRITVDVSPDVPVNVKISPDGANLYLLCSESATNYISIYDIAADGSISNRTPVSLNSASQTLVKMAMSDDGVDIYAPVYSHSLIDTFDTSDQAVNQVDTLSTSFEGVRDVAFSTTSATCFVIVNQNNGIGETLYVIDTKTQAIINTITLPADINPESIAYKPGS